MLPEKLVYMANQIAKFFAPEPEPEAVAAIADHLLKFWDPRMRAAISAYAAQGGAGLEARALKAVQSLAHSKSK